MVGLEVGILRRMRYKGFYFMDTNNSKKIILDLCGGTGSWSLPYKKHGYDVRNITLPDYDVIKLSEDPELWKIPLGKVYGILAAPPCTQFSVAKTHGRPRDMREGMKIVNACLKIIWSCQYNLESPYSRKTTLKFWAMENPKGMLELFLGKPAFQFQPYEFGDNYSKKTCLWGNFNEPKRLVLISIPPPRKNMKYLFNPVKEKRDFKKIAELRSITPKGFAEAFFRANQ